MTNCPLESEHFKRGGVVVLMVVMILLLVMGFAVLTTTSLDDSGWQRGSLGVFGGRRLPGGSGNGGDALHGAL
ncbi:MAG TPA: hypothetical protein HPP77_08255 [Candidatus Hydrogenedentes bacterium]|nr:hypothetical protein [Candidatus Hydrogenedentota bacterium]HIJ74278.1 hypothetical protein [Candidatus Hydrogenedentota bacterium]